MPRDKSNTCYSWFLKALADHNSDECLLWPFGLWQDGYGKVRVTNGPLVRVHRQAFEIMHGRPPVPCALHTCDTPTCFNHRHLFEGTKGQNNSDRAAKGRSNIGEDRPQAKLTEGDVRKIRGEYMLGNGPAVARKYGVDTALIMRIVHRQAWKHVK